MISKNYKLNKSSMKSSIIATLLVFQFVCVQYAVPQQNSASVKKRAKDMVDKINADVTLDSKQVKSLTKEAEDFFRKRDSASIQVDTLKAMQLKIELGQKLNNSIDTILTTTQKEKRDKKFREN